ncbi:hypothetical protein BIZ92_20080 [Achromobacter xylosoxidans]|uniref:Uncharacterized protein n=2 Tax=Alcaligenes xylosoxydans xylosoxydans TaxID=85698 RepID=A0A1R1JXM6_ALCXX|nr:hypothetical protein BIZ92_20080 [Achromobacter xylosoxidans]
MSMTTNFIPSDNLKHYVEAGNLNSARSALVMELDDAELEAADLRAAQAWAASRVAGLYEAYAESAFVRAIDREEGHWNVEYFDTQMVYLKMNFCEARFLHLIAVRQKLRDASVGRFQAKAAPEDVSRGNHRPAASPSKSALPPAVRALLIVGGAAAALALFLTMWGK